MQSELLTTKEIQSILKLGKTKVSELIREGEIESLKIGAARRATRAALETFIANQARKSA